MSIRDAYPEDPRPRHTTVLQHAGEAAWRASREERNARFHRGTNCPTRAVPYGPGDPFARRVHDQCAASGCLDLHHDLIARVLTKLDALDRDVLDLDAYTFRIASRELIDLKRAERSGSGFPAKPGRSDGVAGRVIAHLDDHPTHSAWLVALFRILRSYPFSPHHVPGRWPVDGLVDERVKLLPHEPGAPAVVRREIAYVLAAARAVAGHDWVYTNITLPLHANGACAELTEFRAGAETGPDAEAAILSARLRTAYQLHRASGLDPASSFARASLEVTGLPAPALTAELAAALAELEPCFVAAA